jgi:hypothetical protein
VKFELTDHFKTGGSDKFLCGGGPACACHGALLVSPEIPPLLEELRMATGHPLRVNSCYRCDDYNEQVGGHVGSFHRLGMAADVTSWLVRKDLEKWAKIFGEIAEHRLGEERGNVIWYRHRGFIHVDVGHRIADLVRVNESQPRTRRGY